MRDEQSKIASQKHPRESGEDRIIPVRQLLGETRAVRLAHDGDIYLLRITRNGKLILTK
ncbi:MAG: hemin uptake protein HemP [Xanthomonadales bacterium]|nr:hemin uptake protein HemP [Xanthomonadales bacterium]